jgi:regulator of protease activity HflC (stomatin/prohibitin superfamily)
MAADAQQVLDNFKRTLMILFGGVLLLIIIFGSFYTIESGQEGVLLTFSRAEIVAKDPGLHVKVPLVQKIVKFDVKTQKYEADATAASHDLQDVHAKVAVNYHLVPGATPKLFAELGAHYEDRIIQPNVQEVVKGVTAQYSAEELITKRSEVKNAITVQLKDRLTARDIVVEDISITNFEFSESFSNAIEQKVTAEQLKLKAERDLERIKIEAEQQAAQARGQRDAQIALAQGEQESIRLIQQELTRSPQYIEWLKATKWDGRLPMVTGGATPMITLSESQLS